MKRKINLTLLALICGAIVTPVIAENAPPQPIRGINIDTMEGGEEYTGYDYVAAGQNAGMNQEQGIDAPAIGEKTRDQRIKEMETDFLKTQEDPKQAKGIGSGGSDVDNAQEDAKGSSPAQKAVREPKKPSVIFVNTSTFNRTTIKQHESEAAVRDTASYQEFLKESAKK